MGATNFAMLGLGDIVIPGIFIALLLRWEGSFLTFLNCICTDMTTVWSATPTSISRQHSLVSFHKNAASSTLPIWSAYLAGLLLTIFVMHVYKHAQPALLYLVPACLGRFSQCLFVSFLIMASQGSLSSWRWWGGTSSQCSSMRTTPTLRRRRPIRSLPAYFQCLILQILVWKPSVTICCLMIDTLPATLLSSVHMFFSPSQAEYIWYFWPSLIIYLWPLVNTACYEIMLQDDELALPCTVDHAMPCTQIWTNIGKLSRKGSKDQLQTKRILTAYRLNFFVGDRLSEMWDP